MPLVGGGEQESEDEREDTYFVWFQMSERLKRFTAKEDKNRILGRMPTFHDEEPTDEPKLGEPLFEAEIRAEILHKMDEGIKRDHKTGGRKNQCQPQN